MLKATYFFSFQLFVFEKGLICLWALTFLGLVYKYGHCEQLKFCDYRKPGILMQTQNNY